MKKSYILVLIVILICAVSFTGCNSSTPVQKLLGDNAPWMNSIDYTETSVFNVTCRQSDDAVIKGKYTVTVRRVYDDSVTVNDNKTDNFNGFFATSNLQMDNGDYQKSSVIFTTAVIATRAYFESSEGGKTVKVTSVYEDKKCKYTGEIVDADGKKTLLDDTVKHKTFYSAPYCDNTMIYLVARCLPTGNKIDMGVPIYATNKLSPVRIECAADAPIGIALASDTPVEDAPKASCRLVNVFVNKTFPKAGTKFKCYISTQKISNSTILAADSTEDGATNSIVKIIEDNVEYQLVSCVKTPTVK